MAGSQNPPSSPTQSCSKKTLLVTEPPKFDLESYIQNYQGRTRLERLLHIGVCSTFLGVDALKLAVKEAKRGKDTKRYIQAQGHLQTIGPSEPEARRDQGWIEATDKKNQAETNRLQTELNGYKHNLIKESIRMGNEDLGKQYQAMGDLPKASEAFSRMRQDISVSKHIVDVSRHLIEVATEQRNWITVTSNVQKIRGILSSADEDKSIIPYLQAAEALACFDNGEYGTAANLFLGIDTGLGSTAATIISPNDVAIYGGLCALATMDRNELQKKVLENSSFRTYLELEPQIRRAIAFFVNSRYTACLSVLETYRADYLLDIYLQKHIEDLYHMVRSKSIVQYFIPFSCVTLDSMNQAFAAPGKTIDKELAMMIQNQELNARINTIDKLLEAVPSNPRTELQRGALQITDDYAREARRRIMHMNVSMGELEVKGKRGHNMGLSDDLFGETVGRELRSRGGGSAMLS
ncbi:COP9 signalosome complex subunit [Lachnellula occidentalis]|uniref:COP9 signalosome complex subunit 1 n=1 Tax=Lachnellula occidentalis TaxID=215460 RepID=A0A8H8UD52_9HELO|nr:COP9 signalosome complex subunit [Lachnellula occidentalis]